MTTKTRNDHLADLSDSIRELTEPRKHTEYREIAVREEQPAGQGRRRKAKRTRRRSAYSVMLPSLLDALRSAAIPGAALSGSSSGGFESRPSAELEPLAVLAEIISDVGFWARTFSIDRVTLAGNLSALVGAPHDDEQLGRIAIQAERWVKRARMATGFDPLPMTLNEPCPYCLRRHALVISGDLLNAHCTRCGLDWTPDTIGLLAEMLRANQDQETAVLVRCQWPECHVRGVHETHQDSGGRTWRDTCDVEWLTG